MAFDIQKTNIEITATDKTKVAFDSVRSNVTGMAGQLGALTGLLGAGAFVAFTKRIIDQADGMNDLSKRTGIAVEQIGAWSLATEQSGTSMDALTQALGKGAQYLVKHGEELQKIGINAKTSEELILQLSGVISKMPSDDPRRTALAMQVLGKSAGELIPLLSEGEQGLRKMLDTGREANQVTTELAQNADKFKDNLAELSVNSGKLAVNFVGVLLPSLNQISQKMLEATKEGNILKGVLAGVLELGTQVLFGNEETRGASKISAVGNRIKLDQQRYATLLSGGSTQKAAELLKDIENQKIGYRALILKQSEPYNKKTDDKAALTAAQAAELKKQLENGNGNGSAGLSKTDSVGDRIKALAMENKLLAQGVPLEDARTIARLKGEKATDAQIVKILNETAAQNQYEAAEKASQKTKEDLIKATEGHAEAMLKLSDASFDAVKNAQDEAAAQERNLQVMQLGESAVIRMDAARLNEAAASAEQGLAYARLNGLSSENIGFVEIEILRIRQLAAARLSLANGQDAQTAFEKDKQRIEDLTKAQDNAFKQTEQDVKRTADSIYNSITDSLVRSFEKGNGSFKSFLKGLQNTAKTAAIRLGIDFVMNASGLNGLISQVARVVSGAGAGAGAGGSSSILGQLSSIKDVFSSGNNAIVGGIGSLGQSLSAFGSGGTGILRDLASSVGSFTQLNAGLISNAAPYAGAILQLAQGNIAGAAFTAIGTAIAGPIGGAIGSLLGSALGGIFGGHVSRPKYYANTLVSSSGSVVTGSYGNSDAKGDGGGIATKNSLSFADAILEYAKILGASVKDFNLGVQYQQKYDAFLLTIGKPIGDGSGKDISFKRADAEAGIADAFLISIKKGFIGIPQVLQDIVKRSVRGKNDTALTDIQALASIKTLYDSLSDLPPVFNAISYAIKNASLSDAAKLTASAGAISTYTSLFYTAEEQFDTFVKQLTSQTGALGLNLPKTRDEYRKLVDGISVVDKSSSNLFNGLIAISPAMDAYFKQLEAQKSQVDALTDSMRDMNSFTSLAEYRTYKGVAENYSPQLAHDYVSNLGKRNVGNTSGGQSTVGNVVSVEMVQLLRELRDFMKQNLSANEGAQGTLERISLWGIPANA